MIRHVANDVARTYRRQGWRVALLQLLGLIATSVAIGLVALALDTNIAGVEAYLSADLLLFESRLLGLSGAVLAAIAIVSIPVQVAIASATVRVSDAGAAGIRTGVWRFLGEGLKRFPSILLTVLAAVAWVVAAVVLIPVFLVVGLLGLAATGVRAVLRRKRPELWQRMPEWRFWGFVAIPGGVAARAIARAGLMLPVAVVDRLGTRDTVRATEPLAQGRRRMLAAVLVAAMALAVGISALAGWAGNLLWGFAGATIVGGIVQFVVVPLPIVAATALYRRTGGDGAMATIEPSAPRVRVWRLGRVQATPRMAVTLLVTMVLGGLALPIAVAPPAGALPADDGVITVNSSADPTDPTEQADAEAACAAVAAGCTVRGAFAVAQGLALAGSLTDVLITFSADAAVTVNGRIEFTTTTAPGSGTVRLDSGGHAVTLSSTGDILVNYNGAYWNLEVDGIAFTGADNPFGTGGALVVSAGSLLVENSTFYGNTAAKGGAIYSLALATIRNSTFSGNKSGTFGQDGGADLFLNYASQVINSTFINSGNTGGSGGSAISGSLSYPAVTLQNVVIAQALGGGVAACRNLSPSGTGNVIANGDTTCSGATYVSVTANPPIGSIVSSLSTPSGASVPVHELNAGYASILGIGSSCPATDQVGRARSTPTGCDPGAVEAATATSLAISATGPLTTPGVLTVSAQIDASIAPQGSVTFTVDGVPQSPVATQPGNHSVSLELTGLSTGQVVEVSADYTSTNGLNPATAGPQNFTVAPVPVSVDLLCANEAFPNPVNAPECLGPRFNIHEGESIHLYANVQHAGPGTAVLTTDAAGTQVVAGPQVLTAGKASFVVPAATFGIGVVPELYAVYTSDDGDYAGTSPIARSLVVQYQPTVTVSPAAATGTYGDVATGAFTVTVSGSAGTPTGTVALFGRVGTLDASGQAVLDLSMMPVGITPDLVATYAGDEIYGRGESVATQYPTTAASTQTVISGVTPSPATFGEDIEVEVTVTADAPSTADPQGDVVIEVVGGGVYGPTTYDPVTQDRDGVAVYSVTLPAGALTAGMSELVASFTGTDNFDDSVSIATDVNLSSADTTTVLAVSPASAVWGDSIELTATVTSDDVPTAPTGSVTFREGSTVLGTVVLGACDPVAQGCAAATLEVDTSVVGVGEHNLSATFVPGSGFLASSDTIADYSVERAQASVNVTTSGSVVYPATGTANITVGDVSLRPDDGTTVSVAAHPSVGDPIDLGTATLTDGFASVSLGSLVPDTYDIVVDFAGDSTFEPSQGSGSLTVSAANTAIVVDGYLAGTSVRYGNSLSFTARITNTSNTHVPQGEVVFSWLGHEIGSVPSSSFVGAGPNAWDATVTGPMGWGKYGYPSTARVHATFVPEPGYAESSDLVTGPQITINPATTRITLVMSPGGLGSTVGVEATVSVLDGAAAEAPTGRVDFYVDDVGPVAVTLVDGQATLPGGIALDQSGSYLVNAWYVPLAVGLDSRFVAEAPDNFAFVRRDVSSQMPTLTASAVDSTVEYGEPMSVQVSATGPVAVTGSATLLDSITHEPVSQTVALVEGAALLAVTTPSDYGVGNHSVFVHFEGTGSYTAMESDPVTFVVTAATTELVLDTPTRSVLPDSSLYPGIVGVPMSYFATASSAHSVPSGTVNFYRDGVILGTSTLDAGVAVFTFTPSDTWDGEISAVYSAGSSLYQGSTDVLEHEWIKAPVTIHLVSPPSPRVGVEQQVTAYVTLDDTEFPYMATSLRPGAPTGTLQLSDGDGAWCSTTLTANSAYQAEGDCDLTFLRAGNRDLVATFYPASYSYAYGESTTIPLVVGKGTPSMSFTPHTSWGGLSTSTIAWYVAPATSGTVTLSLGSQTVCTSTSLSGSCDITFPAYALTDAAQTLTLSYAGNDDWAARSQSVVGDIVACIPWAGATTTPAAAGIAVTASPVPNCGGETGFYEGSTVYLNTPPSDSYRLKAIGPALVPVPGAGSWYSPITVTSSTAHDNGSVSAQIVPRLQVAGGHIVPASVAIELGARCKTVGINVTGRGATLNDVSLLTAPNCGTPVTFFSSTSMLVQFEMGTQVQLRYQDPATPNTQFYGWTGQDQGQDPLARTATFTVSPERGTFYASFGPKCYATAPSIAQPAYGTLAVNLPASNCTDPVTKVPGYLLGTPGTLEVLDTHGLKRVVAGGYWTGSSSGLRWVEDYAWEMSGPSFFKGWTGDTGAIVDKGSELRTGEDGVIRTLHKASFTIGEQGFGVGADYGRCAVLTTESLGSTTDGAPGSIRIDTPANCPTAPKGSPWYEVGTTVQLTAVPGGTNKRFLGWDKVPVPASARSNATISFAIVGDTAASASFGHWGECSFLTTATVPASALSLETSFGSGSNPCTVIRPNMYEDGTEGNWTTIDATTVGADAEGAEIVFAYTTYDTGNAPISTVWKRSSQFSENLFGDSSVIAYACEFVALSANVYAPGGDRRLVGGASNIQVGGGELLGEFIESQPADCSTGSDPRSGYGGYAWVVGTQLLPVVVADPQAYRFTGWSGDITGTTEVPTPLPLVGPGRTATGDNYHYRVAANFEAICYTLSIPYDTALIEVLTEPNCPGMEPSQRMYLGGTAVVLHAADHGDTLFRHWKSGVDASDDHWASVTMSSDKEVVAYYSEKSAGEYIDTYGTLVGDSMAIASKKMVGVVAAATSAYFKTVVAKASLLASGIGYLAQGLEAAGVHGSFIDGMKDASKVMDSMLTMMFAPLDCITVWSAGGENTAIYAAQNIIGQAIVTAATASAAKPQEVTAATSTFAQLKQKALAAKQQAQPAISAAKALYAAKNAAEKANSIGLEGSAYDAWGSEESWSVLAQCMKNRMGGAALVAMDRMT